MKRFISKMVRVAKTRECSMVAVRVKFRPYVFDRQRQDSEFHVPGRKVITHVV